MEIEMMPLRFPELMERALREYGRSGSLYGVRTLYRHEGKYWPVLGQELETPFGLAAGPHTQLAQNIVAGYGAGARYFELKTVQTLDGPELARCIPRPCILARAEGYNVEWSTELTVEQAFDQNLYAWCALSLLSRTLKLGSERGFAFNMSVGYDYAGICSPKIDAFIEGLKDAGKTRAYGECMDWAKEHGMEPVSPKVCDTITLSTLHGCPKEEIKRICAYLIREKGLNTFVKCNPTMLGYDFVRKTLDGLGYGEIAFDDHHFNEDMQYGEAVQMIRELTELAKGEGVQFGVKLSNTLPVDIKANELPGEEMYMSGAALYPLTVALAARMAEEFRGELPISFAGGADALNLSKLLDTGVRPVTMATTLLKPGGYERLYQMAQMTGAHPAREREGIDAGALKELALDAAKDPRYARPMKVEPAPKIKGPAPHFDCFAAGCTAGCPIEQDIPGYLDRVEKGEYAAALELIYSKNPLPSITGAICPHTCQSGCARRYYEESVHIRSAKHLAAVKGLETYMASHPPREQTGPRVAVVGGGPGGIAAASLLARGGARVTLFEQNDALGGLVHSVIPSFRIPDSDIKRDLLMLEATGVDIRLNTRIESPEDVAGFDRVVVAVGANLHSALPLEEGVSLNAIDFLKAYKKDPGAMGIRGHVVVVGGGNTAVDAARAALRLPGVESVRMVYRRTAGQMPADGEELGEALKEGVHFSTLSLPVKLSGDRLLCTRMRLGEICPDGRRGCVPTEECVEFPCDFLIAAIGEKPDPEEIGRFGPDAILVGDVRRGPATVVEAIADALHARDLILGRPEEIKTGAPGAVRAKGVLELPGEGCDAGRCLNCLGHCLHCVEVCPNRANVCYVVDGRPQVLHLDALCNECGNCADFCPYEGAPYRDKLTFFADKERLLKGSAQGFAPAGGDTFCFRLEGRVFEAGLKGDIPEDLRKLIMTMRESGDLT